MLTHAKKHAKKVWRRTGCAICDGFVTRRCWRSASEPDRAADTSVRSGHVMRIARMSRARSDFNIPFVNAIAVIYFCSSGSSRRKPWTVATARRRYCGRRATSFYYWQRAQPISTCARAPWHRSSLIRCCCAVSSLEGRCRMNQHTFTMRALLHIIQSRRPSASRPSCRGI